MEIYIMKQLFVKIKIMQHCEILKFKMFHTMAFNITDHI
jgi:hypothetical protein